MSTRHGGVSEPPFASLNLDHKGPDNPLHRAENRKRFCTELGFGTEALTGALQVHGTDILVSHTPGISEGYDAFITDQTGLLLAVGIADCTPVLIYDSRNHCIAAIHAGWRGTVNGIVQKTFALMSTTYGTAGADCFAYIGPCIDGCDFEVGDEVAEQFSPDFKTWDAGRGKFMVDLKKANAAQVRAFGIPESQVEISPFSTITHNADFFSYRAEGGTTGRMLAAIGLK